jgi:hypothetical protein
MSIASLKNQFTLMIRLCLRLSNGSVITLPTCTSWNYLVPTHAAHLPENYLLPARKEYGTAIFVFEGTSPGYISKTFEEQCAVDGIADIAKLKGFQQRHYVQPETVSGSSSRN